MDTEKRSSHGQVLPRERRSMRVWWPGFLTGFDWGMVSLARSRMQRSNPHPEVPRRGLEGRGLRAWGRVRGGCFEGATRHLSMRTEGLVSLQNSKGGICRLPPLPCRASPPQVGRFAGRWLAGSTASSAPASPETDEITQRRRPQPISPPVGEMPGRAEGGELAPASNMYRFTAG